MRAMFSGRLACSIVPSPLLYNTIKMRLLYSNPPFATSFFKPQGIEIRARSRRLFVKNTRRQKALDKQKYEKYDLYNKRHRRTSP
jgi:hypothetical protein